MPRRGPAVLGVDLVHLLESTRYRRVPNRKEENKVRIYLARVRTVLLLP